MFYTVYKTTNTVNSKIYIGMHQTKKADDRYLGSGKLLTQAIKKYGREAFKKEVLFVFETPEEMIAKERELVTVEFVARGDTYNLNVGGDGGWFHANKVIDHKTFLGKHHTPEFKSQMGALVWLRRGAEATRVPIEAAPQLILEGWERGRARSISEGMKGNRSSTGRVWVRSPEGRATHVSQEDLEGLLRQGWHLGKKSRWTPTEVSGAMSPT